MTVLFDYNLCNLLLLKQKTAAFGVRFTCLIQAFFLLLFLGFRSDKGAAFKMQYKVTLKDKEITLYFFGRSIVGNEEITS